METILRLYPMGFQKKRATTSTRTAMGSAARVGLEQGVSCWVCGWRWRDMVPAYQEVVHYSPNWVTWANKERGLVGVVNHVDV